MDRHGTMAPWGFVPSMPDRLERRETVSFCATVIKPRLVIPPNVPVTRIPPGAASKSTEEIINPFNRPAVAVKQKRPKKRKPKPPKPPVIRPSDILANIVMAAGRPLSITEIRDMSEMTLEQVKNARLKAIERCLVKSRVVVSPHFRGRFSQLIPFEAQWPPLPTGWYELTDKKRSAQ